jgi:hypothetical protein
MVSVVGAEVPVVTATATAATTAIAARMITRLFFLAGVVITPLSMMVES